MSRRPRPRLASARGTPQPLRRCGRQVAVAALMVNAGGGDTPAAFAVEAQPEGMVSFEIRSLEDPKGLEKALASVGIPASVTYLAAGDDLQGTPFPTGALAEGRPGDGRRPTEGAPREPAKQPSWEDRKVPARSSKNRRKGAARSPSGSARERSAPDRRWSSPHRRAPKVSSAPALRCSSPREPSRRARRSRPHPRENSRFTGFPTAEARTLRAITAQRRPSKPRSAQPTIRHGAVACAP